MKIESFLLALLTISTVMGGAVLIACNMSTSDPQVEPQVAAFDRTIKSVEPNGDPVGGGGGGPGKPL